MGEGFQSWIQIDVDGKWYGRGIKCVEDVTDEYSDYAGYIPYYCSRMAPLIGFHPLLGSFYSPKVNVGNFNSVLRSLGQRVLKFSLLAVVITVPQKKTTLSTFSLHILTVCQHKTFHQ